MAATLGANKRLLGLVLIALALWFFKDSFDLGPVAPARPASATKRSTVANSLGATRPARTAPPEDVCTVPAALPQRAVLLAKAAANPFVEPPPPVPKLPKPVKSAAPLVAPVAQQPAEPPPPPPVTLPYTYIGQFVDPGRPTTVFLTKGASLYNVHPGDTLDGGFRLESIGPRELVFVHLQRNATLRLPIEGDRL